jgi:hypothetical protein
MKISHEIFSDSKTTIAIETSKSELKTSKIAKESAKATTKSNNFLLYMTTKKGEALFEYVTIQGIRKNNTKKFTIAKSQNSTKRHKAISSSTAGFDPNRRFSDPFDDYFHREFKNVYNHKGLDKKHFKNNKFTKKINSSKLNVSNHNHHRHHHSKHRKGGGKHHKTTENRFTLPTRTLTSNKLSTKYKFLSLNNSRYQQIKKRLENANIANAEDLALNLANVDTIYINDDDDYEFQLTMSITTTKASKLKSDDDEEDYETDTDDEDDESDDDDDDDEISNDDADSSDDNDDEDGEDEDEDYEDDYDEDDEDDEEVDYVENVDQEKSNATDKSLIDICKLFSF